MLLSMTGIGEARAENERLAVSVELRSVNNRHLKVSLRGPDAYLSLEHDIEKLVRSRVSRGTINVNLRIDRLQGGSGYTVQRHVLGDYVAQLRTLAPELHLTAPGDLSALLMLPGVIVEGSASPLEPSDGAIITQAMHGALDQLQEFRVREGAAMAAELSQLCNVLEAAMAQIATRAPLVVEEYRVRLQTRIAEILREARLNVSDIDLVREVGLFADRSDIHEELTRLRCHVEQFRSLIAGSESSGRTMEFLCQELNREVNTIGSKANDVEIGRCVVDCKGSIERIREIVQNVE
ncbi:MAG: YicC family protein [Planctomycetaceae bacterium]|nr:YicC family protein [Planctomycetaceae bacterium]